jgi:hypothetical protein
MAATGEITIGLVAAYDDRDLADDLAEDLPPALRERLGDDLGWRTEVLETDHADVATTSTELLEAVRRRLVERGWQLGLGLTTLPLRQDRRPVAAHASASHGAGLVSIPALGAVNRRERLLELALDLVEALLGDAGDRDDSGREDRMAARGAELGSPIESAEAARDGTLRFAGRVVLGNLRLLTGMVRANRPTRVMGRLSRSAAAALGTGAVRGRSRGRAAGRTPAGPRGSTRRTRLGGRAGP